MRRRRGTDTDGSHVHCCPVDGLGTRLYPCGIATATQAYTFFAALDLAAKKPGDVVEAEIEKVGILRNPIVSWQHAHGVPAPAKVEWGA